MDKNWLIGSGSPQGRPEVFVVLQRFVHTVFTKEELVKMLSKSYAASNKG